MATKKDHVLCVTCQTKLPPETEIHYFSQSRLFPATGERGCGEEVEWMIDHMAALFNVIGHYAEDCLNEEPETIKELGKLGHEVAEEAKRRMKLLEGAERYVSDQLYALRKRLGEEGVA